MKSEVYNNKNFRTRMKALESGFSYRQNCVATQIIREATKKYSYGSMKEFLLSEKNSNYALNNLYILTTDFSHC